MFERFAREARVVVEGAVGVARELGDPAVEAEHLLLAAGRGGGAVAGILRDAGLDFDGLTGALAAETQRSLAAVGVEATPPSSSPWPGTPRFATSSKLALERALRVCVARGEKRIEAGHVVLGVLRAGVGTVPRALDGAGVDRAVLTQRVEAAL